MLTVEPGRVLKFEPPELLLVVSGRICVVFDDSDHVYVGESRSAKAARIENHDRDDAVVMNLQLKQAACECSADD